MKNQTNGQTAKNYDKLIKVLQICAAVFMLVMVVLVVIFMKKNNISVKNVDSITNMLTGGTFTVACMIILFNLIKSFALVVTPSIIFVVSGIVFENVWVAILVNFIAVAIGLIPPYFLGKFTGKGMVDTLTRKFPKVKKLDDFAGKNSFVISFIVKASGIIPGDTSSLILGAMNLPFKNYYLGATLGTLPLNIMWALLGNKGDLSNPYTFLYLLPIVVFAVVMSIVVNKLSNKKGADDENAQAQSVAAAEESAEK